MPLGPAGMAVLPAKETLSNQKLLVMATLYVGGAGGGGAGSGMQVDVGQAAHPCRRPYGSKPHDRSQCLIACVRVLMWGN